MTSPCAQSVRDAVRDLTGKELSDEAADEFVRKLNAKARENAQLRRARSVRDSLDMAAKDLTNEESLEALARERMETLSILKRADREAFYKRFEAEGGNLGDALQAQNVGTENMSFEGGFSVDAQAQALTDDLWRRVMARLDEAQLMPYLTRTFGGADEQFELDVSIEMSRRNGGAEAATGNDRAVQAAEIFGDAIDEARRLQNNEGAFIAKLDGYIVRQSHDPLKVGGGFWSSSFRKGKRDELKDQAMNAWIADIAPRLDERTFDGIEDRQAFLGQMWENIVSGEHGHKLGADQSDLSFHLPSSSRARQISQRRTLHFKDASAWHGYRAKYGQGTLIQTVMGDLERAAKNTALMRVWGPNPDAAYRADKERLFERANAKGDRDAKTKLRSRVRDWEFQEIAGMNNTPGSVRAATVFRWLRLSQVVSKLGGMTLSALSDVPLAVNTLARAGVNVGDAYSGVFAGITRMQSGAKKEAAALLGTGVRSQIGDITTRFAATDGAFGKAAWLQNAFYTINGFRLWADGNRRGVAAILSNHLGKLADQSYDGLDAATRGTLGRYGIDEAKWDVVRKHVQTIEGDKFITTDIVNELTDADIRTAFGLKNNAPETALRRSREDLRIRVQAYFTDQVQSAQTEARARERAKTSLGTAPGTVVGEAVRSLMQFKSFPVTVMTRHVAPSLRGVKGVSPKAGFYHLLAMTTLMGFVAMQTKQIAKGLSPRPLTDEDGNVRIETGIAALMQGGGLGIFGDFLFADTNRFGGGLAETLGGPLVGEFAEATSILRRAAGIGLTENRGEAARDTAGDAVNFLAGNTPLLNLFYTQAAARYLFLYHLQEWASPGYLQRYERRIEREQGQEFLVRPSDVVE